MKLEHVGIPVVNNLDLHNISCLANILIVAMLKSCNKVESANRIKIIANRNEKSTKYLAYRAATNL